MMRIVLTAALLLLLAPQALTRTLQRVLIISGTCARFEFAGNDETQFCQDKISVELFDDGRANFTFFLKRIGSPDVINTFTGQADQATTNRQGVSAEPIDGFMYTFGRAAPKGVKAAGICKFGNLYKPKSFVECTVEIGDKRFNLRFEGDASAPVTLNPR